MKFLIYLINFANKAKQAEKAVKQAKQAKYNVCFNLCTKLSKQAKKGNFTHVCKKV